VLAVDPGRAKCGVAAVNSDFAVLHRCVAPTPTLTGLLSELVERFRPTVLLVGDGTGAEAVCVSLRPLEDAVPLLKVDEQYTSEEARRLYLAEHPARGWRRLIPSGMRFPEEPYDDYVAIILARRWWQGQPPDA
jgi:hypothetical protein